MILRNSPSITPTGFVKSAVEAWEKAVKKSLDVNQLLLGKRPTTMDIFVTDISRVSTPFFQNYFFKILNQQKGLK